MAAQGHQQSWAETMSPPGHQPAASSLPSGTPRTVLLPEAQVGTATPQTDLIALPSQGVPRPLRSSGLWWAATRPLEDHGGVKQTLAKPWFALQVSATCRGAREEDEQPSASREEPEPKASLSFAYLVLQLLGWELVGIPSGYTGVNPYAAGNQRNTSCLQTALSTGTATNSGGLESTIRAGAFHPQLPGSQQLKGLEQQGSVPY